MAKEVKKQQQKSPHPRQPRRKNLQKSCDERTCKKGRDERARKESGS